MEATERDLKIQLEQVENKRRELVRQESFFNQRQTEFEAEEKTILSMNEALQEAFERFNIDKDNFEKKAQLVKEQGELDQADSEKIAFFKANKDRIKIEMKRLRAGLEEEKTQMAEDRVKLEIYKNELRTKQTAIENMRFEYIKATSDEGLMQFANQAKDLGFHKVRNDA